jgi:hypothetical protein
VNNWFKCSWALGKSTLATLRRHPSLLIFPVTSGLALIAVTGAFGVPLALTAITNDGPEHTASTAEVVTYAAIAVAWYFACWFVVIFCNAALIACALQSAAGQLPSVGSGFAAAGRRLPQILGWSLVAATVGLAFQLLESVNDKIGFLGELVASLVESAWSVVTYFVVPVVVTEGVGPIKALKRSTSILRRCWGESLSGTVGLGVILLVLLLPLIPVVAVLATGVGGSTVLVTVSAVGVIYGLAVTVVYTALGAVFRASMYSYATTGAVPNQMDPALLQMVFRR